MQKSMKNFFSGKFKKDRGLFKRYGEIIKGQSRTLKEKPIICRISQPCEKKTLQQCEFDASAKANESHSLSYCLYPGPSLED